VDVTVTSNLGLLRAGDDVQLALTRGNLGQYMVEVVRLFFDLAQIGRKKALAKWRLSLYIVDTIRSFRRAGLKRFYERGDRRRLLAEHVPKIARALVQLDVATDASDMDLPGFHLHQLTGNLAGFWSVTVRAVAPQLTVVTSTIA
jgi:toxin HigB-1